MTTTDVHPNCSAASDAAATPDIINTPTSSIAPWKLKPEELSRHHPLVLPASPGAAQEVVLVIAPATSVIPTPLRRG